MSSINSVVITGRLGKNPEIKYFESGASVTSFTLAVSDFANKKDGTTVENTNWIPCRVWGKIGETICEYCAAGQKIGVQGSLKVESWTKNNQIFSRTYVNVGKFEFLSAKKTDENKPQINKNVQQNQQIPSQTGQYKQSTHTDFEDYGTEELIGEEEIPF